MSGTNHDSNHSALEKFEAARLRLRKKYFRVSGPWREIDGVQYCTADELICRDPLSLDPADQTRLAKAIRAAFPKSHPTQWALVARRFRELYEGLTEDEAVRAVVNGYSSPSAAMRARVIRKRRYVGFGVRP